MLVRLDKTAHRGYNIQRNDTQKHVTTIYCGVFVGQKQGIPHAPSRFAVTRIENPEREKAEKRRVLCPGTTGETEYDHKNPQAGRT